MNQAAFSTNITWHDSAIRREDREQLLNQKGVVVWCTGLSGSGKSTITVAFEEALLQAGHLSYRLDGDNIRHGLNADLTFSPEDRTENIRRIGEVAKLFVDAGVIVLSAFISPYRADRELVRALVAPEQWLEIFIDCSIETCEARDPKGLYKKARAGEIADFTGISAPYEAPLAPALTINTEQLDVPAAVTQLMQLLRDRQIISS
jgi:adenylylsulfate kinase